jgi:hypothetical protein
MLAQQASSYDVGGFNFHIQEQQMHEDLYFCRLNVEELAKPTAVGSRWRTRGGVNSPF